MLRIGSVKLGEVPRVAVPIKDGVSSQKLREIRVSGIDIVELRIDGYSSFEKEYVLKEVKKTRRFPCIATIRSKKEGGRWRGSEEKRLDLFKSVLPYVGAVDIELSSKIILNHVVSSARALKKTVIVSYHDFKKTPSLAALRKILSKAKASGADIVKIAAFARSPGDVRRLAGFTAANRSKHIITISMGRQGVISRIYFPSLGSLITYGSLGEKTAPGQLNAYLTMGLLSKLRANRDRER
jgi:3-dehydroquinate dehydratase-1